MLVPGSDREVPQESHQGDGRSPEGSKGGRGVPQERQCSFRGAGGGVSVRRRTEAGGDFGGGAGMVEG